LSRLAIDGVQKITANSGTFMYKALREAVMQVEDLSSNAPKDRYILLLTDGKSYDGTDNMFQNLARQARESGITISAIGLGPSIDNDRLAEITSITGGRFYEVINVNDLPRIMYSESIAARSGNKQHGITMFTPGEKNHPVLTGLNLSQFPALNTYNALSSKSDEGAEDILVSGNYEDPLLSVWQYGLGRVAVGRPTMLRDGWTNGNLRRCNPCSGRRLSGIHYLTRRLNLFRRISKFMILRFQLMYL
jgi:hypothetical protein